MLTVLLVIASHRRNHKHRIFTALAADMLDFLMLAFALAGAFDGDHTAARGTGMRIADRHHLYMRLVIADGMHGDDLAHAAHHRDRIAGLECFRLGLRFNVRHFRHLHRVSVIVVLALRIVFVVLSAC